ncbi:MAG: DUF1573 domain-containing protein [Bacteroidota bacterium]
MYRAGFRFVGFLLLIPFLASEFMLSSCGREPGMKEKPVAELPLRTDTPGGVDSARIVFDNTEHDFGQLAEGEKVMGYFTYRNTGSSELVLTEVTSICGCTVPDWSREPLPPGEERELRVLFDTDGKSGRQVKHISVSSNGSVRPVLLVIKAQVTK